MTILQMILQTALKLFCFVIVYLMISSFSKALCQKRRWMKHLITGIMSIIVALWIYQSFITLKSMQMQEDILYVHPKRSDGKDLYDGSKNDPNTKEDENNH